MDRLFILIEKDNDVYQEKRFVTRNSEKEVLHYVGITSSAHVMDKDISVERIFSVNEYGKTTFYEVVFTQGKLKLQEQPEVK